MVSCLGFDGIFLHLLREIDHGSKQNRYSPSWRDEPQSDLVSLYCFSVELHCVGNKEVCGIMSVSCSTRMGFCSEGVV